MNRAAMVRSHVETLLEQLTGSDRVVVDEDGDYEVYFGNSRYYVRLVGTEHPYLVVFSVAVEGVVASAELLIQLNNINSTLRFARVFHVGDQVIVQTELIGETLDEQEFDNACTTVGAVTDHYAPLLASTFGGFTALRGEAQSNEEIRVPVASIGGYL